MSRKNKIGKREKFDKIVIEKIVEEFATQPFQVGQFIYQVIDDEIETAYKELTYGVKLEKGTIVDFDKVLNGTKQQQLNFVEHTMSGFSKPPMTYHLKHFTDRSTRILQRLARRRWLKVSRKGNAFVYQVCQS